MALDHTFIEVGPRCTRETGNVTGRGGMRWPSRQEFRWHRAIEQGPLLPPPTPQASLSLYGENLRFVLYEKPSDKTGLKNSTGTPAPKTKFDLPSHTLQRAKRCYLFTPVSPGMPLTP